MPSPNVLHRHFVFSSCLEAVGRVVEEVRGLLAGTCFEGNDAAVMLILREGLANAVKHGNRLDPQKQVRLDFRLNGGEIVLDIEDEGEGFASSELPSPLERKNLGCSTGRGVFLMRHFAETVIYNARGNQVTITIRLPNEQEE
jgi:serine/threonine-protein kinase RsbW